MLKTGFAIAVVLALSSSIVVHAQAPQTPPTVTYDTYMQQDHNGRLKIFNRITFENRADLVRRHITRWIEANQSRLTAEQRSVLEEWLALATPDLYNFPGPDTLAKADELTARSAALLSRDQMIQALSINSADYIPPQP